MSGTYLTQLAQWLREAGLRVTEVSGWQTRARGSGGFTGGRPNGVMWHHTASPPSWDGAKDANYCATGDSDAPLSNLYIDRTGLVWVLAAGATNTNGKGGALTGWSCGTIPQDSMNTNACGIEFGNDGVGGPWPQVQIDAGFIASNTVNLRCGNLASDVCTHQRWAPTRKIDPATAAAVQGPWKPRSVNSSGSWNCDDLIAECVRRAGSSPTPPPTPTPDGDDDMLFDGFWRRDNSEAVYAIYKNGTKQWMTDPGYLNAMSSLQRINGATDEQCNVRVQADPAMFAAFGLVLGPVPDGCDAWGNPV